MEAVNTPMNKANRILVAIILVLAALLIALFAWRTWSASPTFTAIYLRSGDLYFGRLVHFPSFGLKEVYLLQVNQNDTANPLRVQRFRDVFWGPEDFLRISRSEVVWMTDLRSDSQIVNLIKTNPTLAPAQGTGAPQLPAETPPNASSTDEQ